VGEIKRMMKELFRAPSAPAPSPASSSPNRKRGAEQEQADERGRKRNEVKEDGEAREREMEEEERVNFRNHSAFLDSVPSPSEYSDSSAAQGQHQL
jgi:ribosomal protein L12E/L44/L45/RPP1/RPP2